MMKRAAWMMGLFAMAMMMLVACGVEPAQEPAKEAEVTAPPADQAAAESDVRISAFTDGVEAQEACSPVGTNQACCPFSQGCSCTGVRFCEPDGMWGPCLGAGRKGQPCP